jgi:protein-S-isoprenylcysteine O-methyltransferase Ste14
LATLATVVQSLSGLKFAIWLALLVLLVFKSRFEEQLLGQRYEAYAEYKKQTGRFLPRIGK